MGSEQCNEVIRGSIGKFFAYLGLYVLLPIWLVILYCLIF